MTEEQRERKITNDFGNENHTRNENEIMKKERKKNNRIEIEEQKTNYEWTKNNNKKKKFLIKRETIIFESLKGKNLWKLSVPGIKTDCKKSVETRPL